MSHSLLCSNVSRINDKNPDCTAAEAYRKYKGEILV